MCVKTDLGVDTEPEPNLSTEKKLADISRVVEVQGKMCSTVDTSVETNIGKLYNIAATTPFSSVVTVSATPSP